MVRVGRNLEIGLNLVVALAQLAGQATERRSTSGAAAAILASCGKV